MIHGIDEDPVKDAPEFDFIYEQIRHLFNNAIAVANDVIINDPQVIAGFYLQPFNIQKIFFTKQILVVELLKTI